MASTDTDNTKKDCPFLALPPELRLRIYEYALIKPFAIIVSSTNHRNADDDALHKSLAPPALARTCKTLRHESLPVYYGENIFEIYHDRMIGTGVFENESLCAAVRRALLWLVRIGAEQRGMVKGVAVCTLYSEMSIRQMVLASGSMRDAAGGEELRLVWAGETGTEKCVLSREHGAAKSHFELVLEDVVSADAASRV